MNSDELKLKIQALVDNELSESEIPEVLDAIESDYTLRKEYQEILQLQARMKGVDYPQPEPEWFEKGLVNPARKGISLLGKVLFLGSYVLLLGYAVYSALVDQGEHLLIRISIGGITLGILVLLGITIGDRLRERKTDKYKGIIR
ncbi:MAG: hypothetical protein KAU17_06900 [Spirochaetales bacterium]|nr:hypothetical protein [Spirochaetales bacterium]